MHNLRASWAAEEALILALWLAIVIWGSLDFAAAAGLFIAMQAVPIVAGARKLQDLLKRRL